MLHVSLTALIAIVVGVLAFSAYGSLATALVFSILAAVLWMYLVRL